MVCGPVPSPRTEAATLPPLSTIDDGNLVAILGALIERALHDGHRQRHRDVLFDLRRLRERGSRGEQWTLQQASSDQHDAYCNPPVLFLRIMRDNHSRGVLIRTCVAKRLHVVPAKAGTHDHRGYYCVTSCCAQAAGTIRITTTERMGPGVRRDDDWRLDLPPFRLDIARNGYIIPMHALPPTSSPQRLHSAIVRYGGVTPDEPADEPPAITHARPRGSRRPHTDMTVAKVRDLIEHTALTYEQISGEDRCLRRHDLLLDARR